MGKGLLAWWRRRIVARGLAGAALFAVPVAVAALIGFGTGFSGAIGGLSSVTNGPEVAPASAPAGPSKLNRAVALASKRTASGSGPSSSGDKSVGGGSSGGGGGSNNRGGGGHGGGGARNQS